MLVIRLSRQGRSKRPFYRVVLTEHTKPAQCGHLEVLGSYDPLKHIFEADVESIKSWIAKWAQPSERVAKLLFKSTNDAMQTFSPSDYEPKSPEKCRIYKRICWVGGYSGIYDAYSFFRLHKQWISASQPWSI